MLAALDRMLARLPSLERVAPAQPLEPTEITIGAHPFAARFDREGGEVGIGNQIAFGPDCSTQTGEDVPMARAGCVRHTVGLVTELVGERDRVGRSARSLEDAAVDGLRPEPIGSAPGRTFHTPRPRC